MSFNFGTRRESRVPGTHGSSRAPSSLYRSCYFDPSAIGGTASLFSNNVQGPGNPSNGYSSCYFDPALIEATSSFSYNVSGAGSISNFYPACSFGSTITGACSFGPIIAGATASLFSNNVTATGSLSTDYPSCCFGSTIMEATSSLFSKNISTMPTDGLFSNDSTDTDSIGSTESFNQSADTFSLAGTGALLDGNSTSISTSTGLGCNDSESSEPETEYSDRKNEARKYLVPTEIVETVEDKKTFGRQEKQISTDIGPSPDLQLRHSNNEIHHLDMAIENIENYVAENCHVTQTIQNENTRLTSAVNMHDRNEHDYPFEYFQELVQRYDEDMNKFTTEQQIETICETNFPADNANYCLQQLHEAYTSLVNRVKAIHERVQAQKGSVSAKSSHFLE